ncbi:hypothetical protein C7378_0991 [Acidipila rosea]|uniref:Uncharacterized protein n=1 Tax=Acidipila rosea TaxID=768535 RepID=A0A4R1LE17_9BACT|nr:hypothetical protein C7378_0991 [Acidipila rosea]
MNDAVWHNEAMHPKDACTLEEAKDVLRQTKMFVENLAKTLPLISLTQSVM